VCRNAQREPIKVDAHLSEPNDRRNNTRGRPILPARIGPTRVELVHFVVQRRDRRQHFTDSLLPAFYDSSCLCLMLRLDCRDTLDLLALEPRYFPLLRSIQLGELRMAIVERFERRANSRAPRVE